MYKSCSRCGKIHDYNYDCTVGKQKRIYDRTEDRRLRSTNAWTQKSKEIREHAHYLCEVCRDCGMLTYESIEVHHIIKVKNNKELLLDNYNLVCLCQEHHRQADSGLIPVEYLQDLARQREDGNPPYDFDGG